MAPGLELAQPFPNPSSDRTLISYEIPAAGDVSITIYDTQGREVMTWYETHAAPGRYEARWDATTYDGRRVVPGVYMCTVRAGTEVMSRKMVITR